MIPALEDCHADSLGRAELRRQLECGPWVWPDESDRDALDWAREVTGRDRAPKMRPGRVPGVTVHGESATLWLLEVGAAPGGPEGGERLRATLARDAADSWRAAATALPRSLPVLWESVRDAHRVAPRLFPIASWTPAGAETIPSVVDGPSFGLAFVLLHASRVFGEPVPADLMASAAVDASGRVGQVDHLEMKIGAVLNRAPRIRRFMIAADQEDAARAAVGGRLEIVAVRSASEALRTAFGSRPMDRLIEAGADRRRRAELVDSFLRLVLVGRGAAIDWTPIGRGATLALQSWRELTMDHRFALELAAAVAARHERNAGRLPMPPAGWLDERPLPVRVAVVTHYVQQAADVGDPSPADAVAMAAPYVAAHLRNAWLEQLRLAGAKARLRAVAGAPGTAILEQRALAEVFVESLRLEEVSYPLTEWLRLAGALGDRSAYDEACELRSKVEALGGLGLDGSPYVELAKARAEVQLGVADPVQPAPAVLERLAASASIPAHVRWSAARWLIGAWAGDEREQARTAVLAARVALERAAADRGSSDRDAAGLSLALVDLDAALAAGDAAAADAALGRLRALEPGLIGRLEASAPQGERAAYVARFYPY